MKRPLIIANWKMNKTTRDTVRALTELKTLLSGKQETDIGVAPPYTSLQSAQLTLEGSGVQLVAQNMYPAESGAFTGEVSPAMLAELGVSMVLLGHSERRRLLGESESLIRQKVGYAIECGLVPVLCVGESGEEREKNQTADVLERQIGEDLRGVAVESGRDLVIA
jgi:triosephosphate isomerase (TIM)